MSESVEISKNFLVEALKEEVLSFSVSLGSSPGDNYMSQIFALEVDFAKGKKKHFILKCYPNHPAFQEFTNKSNVFYKELQIYKEWIPELRRFQREVVGLEDAQIIQLPYPHFIHGQCIDFESSAGKAKKEEPIDPLDNYILMEDLKKTYGFKMTNRLQCLDLDHCILVINELAKIHALSHAYRHKVEADITSKFPYFLPKLDDKDIFAWSYLIDVNLKKAKRVFDQEFGRGNKYTTAANRFKTVFPSVMDFFAGRASADSLEKLLREKPDPQRFGKDADESEPWRIISFGDAWSNNFLFRYDEAGKPLEVALVDLQISQEACIVNDLTYFIYTCTNGGMRSGHLDTLLQIYHDKFNEFCDILKTPTLPGFCMNSLKYRFHRAKFNGIFTSLIVTNIMLKEDTNSGGMDPKDISSTNPVFKRLIDVVEDMINDGVL